jgi:putative Holliday junction resolvase
VDYGRRRLGLALSDTLWLTAQPLATLERTNRRNDLRRLREIARKHGVARILVGYPVHLDGSASEMAAEAAQFARRLEKELRLPVELVDERLTSWEAEQTIATTKPSVQRRLRSARVSRKSAGDLDQIAAAVILRDYLSRGRPAGSGPAKD